MVPPPEMSQEQLLGYTCAPALWLLWVSSGTTSEDVDAATAARAGCSGPNLFMHVVHREGAPSVQLSASEGWHPQQQPQQQQQQQQQVVIMVPADSWREIQSNECISNPN